MGTVGTDELSEERGREEESGTKHRAFRGAEYLICSVLSENISLMIHYGERNSRGGILRVASLHAGDPFEQRHVCCSRFLILLLLTIIGALLTSSPI